jgi:hypothetical protein
MYAVMPFTSPSERTKSAGRLIRIDWANVPLLAWKVEAYMPDAVLDFPMVI